MNNLRFYCMTNALYMRPIQLGIQTAHAVGEMSYRHAGNKFFDSWVKDHKTIIVLDGGNHGALETLFPSLMIAVSVVRVHLSNRLPVVKFNEDSASLNCATTAVGIVLPEEVWSTFDKKIESVEEFCMESGIHWTPGERYPFRDQDELLVGWKIYQLLSSLKFAS